jgi:hypothetical protein
MVSELAYPRCRFGNLQRHQSKSRDVADCLDALAINGMVEQV